MDKINKLGGPIGYRNYCNRANRDWAMKMLGSNWRVDASN